MAPTKCLQGPGGRRPVMMSPPTALPDQQSRSSDPMNLYAHVLLRMDEGV